MILLVHLRLYYLGHRGVHGCLVVLVDLVDPMGLVGLGHLSICILHLDLLGCLVDLVYLVGQMLRLYLVGRVVLYFLLYHVDLVDLVDRHLLQGHVVLVDLVVHLDLLYHLYLVDLQDLVCLAHLEDQYCLAHLVVHVDLGHQVIPYYQEDHNHLEDLVDLVGHGRLAGRWLPCHLEVPFHLALLNSLRHLLGLDHLEVHLDHRLL